MLVAVLHRTGILTVNGTSEPIEIHYRDGRPVHTTVATGGAVHRSLHVTTRGAALRFQDFDELPRTRSEKDPEFEAHLFQMLPELDQPDFLIDEVRKFIRPTGVQGLSVLVSG